MADQNTRSIRTAVGLMLATVIIILAVALVLWLTNDPKAQGAAITLVGAAATHLIRETQDLLKVILARSP